MAARDPGAALRIASAPGRSRVPVYRSEALSSMEAGRQGSRIPRQSGRIRPKITDVFEQGLSSGDPDGQPCASGKRVGTSDWSRVLNQEPNRLMLRGVEIWAQLGRPISTQSWVLRRSAMLIASHMPIAVSATVKARAATFASMRCRNSPGSSGVRSNRERSADGCWSGSRWPGGCARVRGRNLSTRCSSSDTMGCWVFTVASSGKLQSRLARWRCVSQKMLADHAPAPGLISAAGPSDKTRRSGASR